MSIRVTPLLLVPDVTATISWYQAIGFALVATHERGGVTDWAELELGGAPETDGFDFYVDDFEDKTDEEETEKEETIGSSNASSRRSVTSRGPSRPVVDGARLRLGSARPRSEAAKAQVAEQQQRSLILSVLRAPSASASGPRAVESAATAAPPPRIGRGRGRRGGSQIAGSG